MNEIKSIYDPLDLVELGTSPRSYLYHLEPMGVGTPFVESLSGYIARLAQAHQVTPKTLVSYKILPFQGKDGKTLRHYYRLNSFWTGHASSLNGAGRMAEEWIQTLQNLTLCSNLRFLTMLTWSQVISASRLSRGHKAWCSECYKEWKSKGSVIYEPLLWTIGTVSVCPVHQCGLCTECPYEDCKSKESLLTQVSRPGYCSRCAGWLGISTEYASSEDTKFDSSQQEWQYWVVSAVGDLIASAPVLQKPPQKAQIKLMVAKYIQQIAYENMSALARLSDMQVSVLWSFKYQGKIPYLETLLRFCYKLSIHPLEFLTSDPSPIVVVEKRTVEDSIQLPRRGRGKLTVYEVENIRLLLEAELAKNEPPYSTLEEIEKMFGYRVETLRKHFPELYTAIASRHYKRFTLDELREMRETLEGMLLMENSPVLAEATKKLGCSTDVLRKHFPDLTKEIVAKHQEKFSFDKVQSYLLHVLEDDDEPCLSLRGCAQGLGCSVSIMKTRCPDLCRKVAERYKEYLHQRHEARISVLREEVQQAVLTLHKQGIYPSARQVGFRLSSSKLMLTKEIHELWQTMLIELGWKK